MLLMTLVTEPAPMIQDAVSDDLEFGHMQLKELCINIDLNYLY